MIDLRPLKAFLRVTAMLGMIITVCMMIAVIYKKLKMYYPVQMEKYRWAFVLSASLMSLLMIFLFQKFFSRV